MSWRDGDTKRGAIVRVVLFVPLYVALEFLLQTIAFSLGAGVQKGSTQFEALISGAVLSAATLIAALLAGYALVSGADQRKFGALGFAWTRQTPREIGEGFALGGGAQVVSVLLLLVTGSLAFAREAGTAAGWVQTVLLHLAIFAVAGAAEEAVFRGYAFQALCRGFGALPAALGTSALFALAHANNPNVTTFALVNIFLAGVLLCYSYLRTMSLWFATAVHIAWNWTMASLFDLPVSGIGLFRTPLYEPVEHGARWFSGGSFGPEGGIAGSIGLIAAMIALSWWLRVGVAPEMAALQPIALAAAPQEIEK